MELSEIRILVKENVAVMLYFYNDNCSPCLVLRPKVKHLLESEFPKIEARFINAEQFPVTTSNYGVFASPTLLLFFEEKEYIRESKNISINELKEKISRYYEMIF
jgi:thioredoxin 1